MRKTYYILIVLYITLFSCNEKNSNEIISIFYYDIENIQDSVARDFFNKGIDFAKNKKYQKAQTKFEKANNLEPKNILIVNSLGLVAQALEDFDESESWFQEALSIDSLFVNTYINYGTCLNSIENYKLAIEIMEIGRTKTNNSNDIALLCYNLAISYVNSGNCNKAKETIEIGLSKLTDRSMIREFKDFKREIFEICAE